MENKKIVYILGTKAQFIKSKYILLNLMHLGVNISVLDTGQHKELTKKELAKSGLTYNYRALADNDKNISTIPGMLLWFLKLLFTKKQNEVFDNASYSLVHGDTISTLVGLIVSKLNKCKVIHLESGYKSNNLFNPFPEEIIRNLVSRYSDILVVDGESQYQNVLKYKDTKQIIKIQRNTIIDSVSDYIGKEEDRNLTNTLLVTIHRTENIYSKTKLDQFIKFLIEVSKKEFFSNIEWYCHDVTKNALKKHNHITTLKNNGVILKDLVEHSEFIKKLISAEVVITDGGSIAEECSILGLNTIIWRDVVENNMYLNQNVILSKYDESKIISFIEKLPKKTKAKINKYSPSKDLANKILEII